MTMGAGLVTSTGADENPGSMDITYADFVDTDTGLVWVPNVAALWEVSPATVWSYLDKSKPADPDSGRAAGRYADDPVPTPAGYRGRYPFWRPDQLPDLVAWRLRHQDRGGDRRSDTYRKAQGDDPS